MKNNFIIVFEAKKYQIMLNYVIESPKKVMIFWWSEKKMKSFNKFC